MAARPMESNAPWERVIRGRGMIEPLRRRRADPSRSPGTRNTKHDLRTVVCRSVILRLCAPHRKTAVPPGLRFLRKRPRGLFVNGGTGILACAVLRRIALAHGQMPEWLNGPDCKSGAKATVVRIRLCPPAAEEERLGRRWPT